MTRKAIIITAVILIIATVALAETFFRVDRSVCTGCGDCYEVCPVDAIEIIDGKSHIDPEKYIGCGFCQRVSGCRAIR